MQTDTALPAVAPASGPPSCRVTGVSPGEWRGGHRPDGVVEACPDGRPVAIGAMRRQADAAFVGQAKAMRDALLSVPAVPGMDEWWDAWGSLVGEIDALARDALSGPVP